MTKLTLIVAFGLLFSCNQRRQSEVDRSVSEKDTGVAVKLQTIKLQTKDEIIVLPATLQPWDEAEINFRISGMLANILVEEGAKVDSGQLLIVLDNLVQQADLERAVNDRDQAERNYQRLKNLYQSSSVSQQDYEASLSRYNASLAAYKRSQDSFDNTSIKAPFAGTIERLYVDKGVNVNMGQKALYLVNAQKLKASINIPESSVSHIRVGDQVQLSYKRFNNKEINLTGSILSVASQADKSQSYRSVIAVTNPGTLKAGMILEGRLLRQRYRQAISIPLFALSPKNDAYIVYIDIDSHAVERVITVGFFVGNQVVVTSGLNAGDKLVIEGQQFLSDGAKITVEKLD